MRVVNGITSQLPVLPDPRSFARGLVEDYAATRIDLMALGVSDRIARTVTQAYAPRTLEEDKHQVVPPMPSGSPEICAIVPTDELGRAYLAQRAYLRDSALAQPVRLGATHIATNRGEQIAEIYPIITRYRLGSIRALSTLASSTAQRVRAMPETSEQWDGPSRTSSWAFPSRLAFRWDIRRRVLEPQAESCECCTTTCPSCVISQTRVASFVAHPGPRACLTIVLTMRAQHSGPQRPCR